MSDSQVGTLTGPAESLWWSFFKACVAGFAMGMTAAGLLSGMPFLHAVMEMFFHHLIVSVVMVTMAPTLAIPIRILADLARTLNIPRGASDILIGALMGSLMLLPELARGVIPGPTGLGFLLGGGFGGFMFWRARGYPDREGQIRTLQDVIDAVGARFSRAD